MVASVFRIVIGTSAAETFRTEFERALARRSLRGSKLVITDEHEGRRRLANGHAAVVRSTPAGQRALDDCQERLHELA